ncbi:mannonate dehydratase [Paenibacillus thermotolerans]|uniref:mannonate dehydratase n=1 Tax=Paenibacillus thermotolerans TaxID=3027807 RepID=UPI002367F8FA|nr:MULTISPECIES: mannonate dehydratase [unclassified Paenibacillus]
MRIAIGQFSELSDETLQFARQLGVAGVQLNTPKLPGTHRWEYEDLLDLRLKCEEYGLRLEALENVPITFYYKAMLGLEGRDEQIEHYQATIRNVGRAGIPILGYHFMPNGVWRTSFKTPGRGDSQVSSFDLALVHSTEAGSVVGHAVAERDSRLKKVIESSGDRIVTEDEMWANYEYFIKAVLPVAEEAGVKLALHPDDPPVEMLGGVARIFRNVEGFKKAMEIADSDAWGLDLCLGCCSEMAGGALNVQEMIRYFGPIGKIFYVHFRDVQGTVPKFQECFLGEGNYRPSQVMRLLQEVDFTGFILDDHVPAIVNDSPWGHRSRAHAVGYLQGMLELLESQ